MKSSKMDTKSFLYICKCGNRQSHEEEGLYVVDVSGKYSTFVMTTIKKRICEKCGSIIKRGVAQWQ